MTVFSAFHVECDACGSAATVPTGSIKEARLVAKRKGFKMLIPLTQDYHPWDLCSRCAPFNKEWVPREELRDSNE